MKLWIVLILLFSLAGLSCSRESSEAAGFRNAADRAGRLGAAREPQAVSVIAYQVERRSISTYILANTSLESIRKVEVHSQLNAIVQEILVEEGSFVREDQVLARLDAREFQNEYIQARIAVQQSEVALKQAEVRAQLSQANYERARTLLEQKLISRQEYDQSQLTDQTDQLAMDSARQQLEGARARMEAAEIQLGYTDIRAPITGVVTERMIDAGTRVTPNQPVFTLQEFSPLWARIHVPERELPRLQVGQRARLRVETYPGESFEGVIRMINPTIDPASGTVRVTLEVPQRNNLLRPGMFGSVYIEMETRPDAVVVPRKAIVRERDQSFVYVINPDDTVERRLVNLGVSEEERVEVLNGLQPGEHVVTVGYEGLADGYAVNILSWEGSTPDRRVAAEEAAAGTSEERTGISTSHEASPSSPPGVAGERRGVGAEEAGPARGFQRGGPDRPGPGGAAVSPDRMRAMEERLLSNPEIRNEYEKRLKEDPALAEDPEIRRAFFMEMMQRMREGR